MRCLQHKRAALPSSGVSHRELRQPPSSLLALAAAGSRRQLCRNEGQAQNAMQLPESRRAPLAARALPRGRRRRRRHLPTCWRPAPARPGAITLTRILRLQQLHHRAAEVGASLRASTRARPEAAGRLGSVVNKPRHPSSHVGVEGVHRERLWLPPLRSAHRFGKLSSWTALQVNWVITEAGKQARLQRVCEPPACWAAPPLPASWAASRGRRTLCTHVGQAYAHAIVTHSRINKHYKHLGCRRNNQCHARSDVTHDWQEG